MNTEQKIDKILEKQGEQNIQLAQFLVYQKQQRKEIDDHKSKIENLSRAKDNLWGIVIAIPIIISAAGIIFQLILKH